MAGIAASAAVLAMAFSAQAGMAASTIHSVGSVTRHANHYIGQHLVLRGYLLAQRPGYILFSDEPGGSISRFDLPVTGTGAGAMLPRQRYLIEGDFLDHGLAANNGNSDHFELSSPPRPAP